MYLSKISILCIALGLGGLTATTVTSSILGGSFTSKVKGVKRVWPKDYKNTCYKWVYYDSTTEGELEACEDRNPPATGSTPLRFYLWWLKGEEGEGEYGRLFEVKKINGVDSENLISFTFRDEKVKREEKKLKIHNNALWLKQGVQDLSNTSKDLREICSISLNRKNLICKKDESQNVTIPVQETISYF